MTDDIEDRIPAREVTNVLRICETISGIPHGSEWRPNGLALAGGQCVSWSVGAAPRVALTRPYSSAGRASPW